MKQEQNLYLLLLGLFSNKKLKKLQFMVREALNTSISIEVRLLY